MSWMDKQTMRQTVRARFPDMEARNRESTLICRHVLSWPDYRAAKIVAGYIPLPREADITAVLADALASGKAVLLPRVEGERRMTLRRVHSLDELIPGRWGLLEPPPTAEIISVEAAQVMLVPLEAVDPSGMRLGKGGGYYDTLLTDEGPVTLGIALSWQWVERVPREPWDKPLDAAVDAKGIHLFK